MCRFPLPLLGLLVVVSPATAADSVQERLDKAKTAYRTVMDKQNARVLDGLKNREEYLQKNGQSAAAVQQERATFESLRQVPKWLGPEEYERETRVVRVAALDAYDAALKSTAKGPAADALKAERDVLAVEQAEALAGLFRKGTVWKGTFKTNSFPTKNCQLVVTAVTPAGYEAAFTGADDEARKTVTGTISAKGALTALTSDTRFDRRLSNAKGTGTLKGTALDFVLLSEYAGTNRIVITLKFDGTK